VPYGVVILAAGSSSRLGRPKQLVPYNGTTLVEHAANTAVASGADQVVVVLGAGADAIEAALSSSEVTLVRNPDWSAGMASTIRAGISALSEGIEVAIIALVDQPLVTPLHLAQLASKQAETGAQIVASSYAGIFGVPAAFSRELFPSLLALEGDAGARELIRQGNSEFIEFPGASKDVDTVEALPGLSIESMEF
jgi:molybdenum cofactor cytidylyltransferase